MKTKQNRRMGIAALAGLLIFTLAACADILVPGASNGESIPEGMGLARIRLDAGGTPAQSVRTAVPDIGSYYFTLDFTAPGKTAVNKTLDGSVDSALTLTVALEPAVWTLAVKGYTNSGMGTLKVSGSISVPVTAGTAASFAVYLTPNLGSAGTGSLNYSISFPAGVRGFFGLYPLEAPGTSQEFDISPSAGGSASAVLGSLPQGTYRAVIDLYDRTGNKAAVRSEVVHIYDGLETPFTRSFGAGDFAECAPEAGEGLTTLAAKLDAALNSPAGSYTVVLDGTETDLASFTPKTLSSSYYYDAIHITIRGSGNTVQVSAPNTPLFTLAADYYYAGASLTLAIQDLTLSGLTGNTVPVVQVNYGGTLLMKAGSLITGNTNSSSYYYSSGGGVNVYDGTFSMSGGAVSGNTSSSFSSGGGVYVSGGTVSMSGGEVCGNTSSSSYGGGVYVSSSGTFSMSGGVVSGNTAVSSGGGVYVSSGTFSMSGGAVSGNTSSSGGGVYVYGGTFSMSGGAVVRGNILSGSYSYGREVVVGSGTFKLSGEAMPERVFLYNNTRSLTISGPLGGAVIPIDLGVTGSAPLAGYVNAPILKLDSAYSSGDLASLKEHFTLGNSKDTNSSSPETAITGYTISDEGLFVAE
jgi:hypothetical protein